ncbi:hypothetical protein AB4114_11040 [Paenibacillus sp. 2RAB27]|uniref:phage neck terminator protein n=1 Tax=Paenibacillus sp. 2RAB27 TaxID=3232991 RepID=UPI003F9D3935
MTDTILKLTEAEDLFALLTYNLLGLDPLKYANQDRVRIAWPKDGAPSWKREEDVAFIMLGYDDDAITQQQETSYIGTDSTGIITETASTQVIRVNWNCYGPNSFDDMGKIRRGLYKPEITEFLAVNNLALILNVPMPVRFPELYGGQWWERTTFYARFNELVVIRSSVPSIDSADVQIIQG